MFLVLGSKIIDETVQSWLVGIEWAINVINQEPRVNFLMIPFFVDRILSMLWHIDK